MKLDTMGLLGPNTHPQWDYPPGAIRWRRMKTGDTTGTGPEGWRRTRHLTDTHPVYGYLLANGKKQWWLCETKE